MDAETDAAHSQSEHPPPLLLASGLCDWLERAELQRDRERESDRRIRKKKKKLSDEEISVLHTSVSLPLSLSQFVSSLSASLALSVLLPSFARPCCCLIPEERERFNAMDLLPTDCYYCCCLHRGIMGAVVCSAVQEDS